MKKLFLALVAGIASVGLANAKEDKKVPNASIDQLHLGPNLSGPNVTVADLKGKVVVVEQWGVNCGPCIAAMPTFVKMDKQYGKKGVQVIGMHAQTATDDEVKAMVKKLRMDFTVVNNGSTGVATDNTIPHTFVYGADGVLKFSGHPDKDMERIVREEVKKIAGAAAETAAATGSATTTGPAATTSKTGAATPAATAGALIPERTWTNSEGKTMVATLVSADNGICKFTLKGGKDTILAINKLSPDDQKLIKSATEK